MSYSHLKAQHRYVRDDYNTSYCR